MDTREKLIELLSQVQYLGGLEEKVADHLIANGVTFAEDNNVPGKWIPHNKGRNNWVECSECNTVGSPFWKRCPVCEAKMYLPEPPKGETNEG